MNGFTEPRASGASERPGPGDLIMTWDSSQAMLPLVGRIAADIVSYQGRVLQLQSEQARLERHRRTLNWPQRARRYSIQDELVSLERDLQNAVAELSGLGVVLLDGLSGLVGFPTVVNDRRAYFSWKPGEEGLNFWSFADDKVRHPVPENWKKPLQETGRGKQRPRK